ncbi:IS110 family transposase [Nocardia sp. alder85J]|uniref:IS110 family transposase n=1 Tax=Nocardia sp. alder85J TaxID=2862949 RepID=UPI001CD6D404|nr:IS110 family transposase [Nocardia sp. alder85J]MCX4097495.1 IS110 family transposase [Nocardia sp. alder85J]MCX4098008.1 IS110 family transposase [Nocardia sp. alder85J]
MEVVHARCAGIDISKKDAKVCVRVQGAGRWATKTTVTTWGSMSSQILALREHLIAEQVTCVVMESTGDYWKPFYYLLEDGLNVMLVNPGEARNRPGRKTDVSDSAWLADLGAHGLLRASLVPPPPIRQLRDLTRARTVLLRDRARQVQRIEKILEDAGIKLSAVVSDIMGVSGRAMLDALIAGSDDPATIAGLARGRMRSKVPALAEALTGRFTAHHGYLIRMYLNLVDAATAAITDLDARITGALGPVLTAARTLLESIPGFSTTVAEVFLAETGGDMSVFATGGHLASWTGVCPGANESAGRIKSTKTRPGNRYLKAALGIAAISVSRSKNTYFAAKYRRVSTRRGPMKAIVAVERAMVVAAHSMLTHGDFYRDPGPNYFTARKPGPAKARAVAQLEALGYTVSLQPRADTA